MKKLQRSVLVLCLILAFATVPTAAASIEKINSGEMVGQGEIQPRVVETYPLNLEGDFEMTEIVSGKFLYEGDEVTVSGTWGNPYGIQVRLLQENGGRALMVNLGINDSYTFTVPATGSYTLQAACRYTVSGTLSVNW